VHCAHHAIAFAMVRRFHYARETTLVVIERAGEYNIRRARPDLRQLHPRAACVASATGKRNFQLARQPRRPSC